MTERDVVSECLVRCVTPGEGHYFFGYYDKSPWDPSGRRMLAGRTSFADRPPGPDDRLEVGTIDLEGGFTFTPLAETRAWNWQQGAMLQWLDERRIIFNDRQHDRFIAVILDVHTGERRQLPRPVYSVSPTHGLASSLSFARLHRLRPGYGYAGVDDTNADVHVPEDDGLWIMKLSDAAASAGPDHSELILSIADARRRLGDAAPDHQPHWLNHVEFAPSGERLSVLHRWAADDPSAPWGTRLLTLNRDGGDVYPLIDQGMCSHYDWRDDNHLLAYARARDAGGLRDGFFRFQDRTGELSPLAPDRLTDDGHCSYSPDRRWVLNDTYPDPSDHKRTLMLVCEADEMVFEVGRFYGPMPEDVTIRCDLHPRWRRDGTQVCIDSIHEGRRGVYVIDVAAIVEGEAGGSSEAADGCSAAGRGGSAQRARR